MILVPKGNIVGGIPDDTAAINAALATGKHVQLEEGDYYVRSINMSDMGGVSLSGDGFMGTRLVPIQSSVPVIDVLGSSGATIERLRIAGTHAPGIVPSNGILCGQITAHYGSDMLCIRDVRVDGNFQYGAMLGISMASSYVSRAVFYNYQPGVATVALMTGNPWGAPSLYQTIDGSGANPVSDITFSQCEMHNFGSFFATYLYGAQDIRFVGGNMSSSFHAGIMGMDGAPTHSCAAVLALGTTFYADFAPIPSRAITGGQGSPSYVTPIACSAHGMPLF